MNSSWLSSKKENVASKGVPKWSEVRTMKSHIRIPPEAKALGDFFGTLLLEIVRGGSPKCTCYSAATTDDRKFIGLTFHCSFTMTFHHGFFFTIVFPFHTAFDMLYLCSKRPLVLSVHCLLQ
ncbi:hypothetical protein FXO38_06448 [Capsicum annuum]|nr:hypothetical protein FXO38_06448 [Capsicum annuum]